MVSVGVIYYVLVLGFTVSKYVKSRVTRACFFFSFIICRIMCVGYLIAICEKDSIS